MLNDSNKDETKSITMNTKFQVSSKCVENLTKSEYRRLMIGVQLVKDPGKVIFNNSFYQYNRHYKRFLILKCCYSYSASG